MIKVNRQLTFLLLAFFLLCTFLYSVSDILLPFVLGILVAYILDPVVDRMEAKRIHRGVASAGILLFFFAAILAICFVTVPLIFEQIEGLISKLPQYIRDFNREVMPMIKDKVERISPELANQLNVSANDIPNNIGEVVTLSFAKVFSSGLWLLNLLSLILITPIVSFYLLRDWDVSLARLYSLLPQNYAPIIKKQAKKIDETISAFLRGQLTICLMLGFFYGIFLTIFGLNFGFIIGLGTGLLTFIPYVGLAVGAITGMTIAYLQFGDDTTRILMIAGVFFVGQVIEGNFVTPRIMGQRIGVHPAWLIFSMLAGGSLLGVLGVIISVPMTAVIAVLIRFAIEQYEHSSYYLRNKHIVAAEPVKLPAEKPVKKRRRLTRKKK